MPRSCPHRDDGRGGIGQLFLIDIEFGPGEKRADRRAEEQGTEDAVYNQENAVGRLAQEVAALGLVFIRDRLQDEAEEDENPHPIGPAKAGRVEQGERGEEGPAEGN